RQRQPPLGHLRRQPTLLRGASQDRPVKFVPLPVARVGVATVEGGGGPKNRDARECQGQAARRQDHKEPGAKGLAEEGLGCRHRAPPEVTRWATRGRYRHVVYCQMNRLNDQALFPLGRRRGPGPHMLGGFALDAVWREERGQYLTPFSTAVDGST